MALSKLENLPSELIVEIGDYLDGCHLYDAFFGLNHRINTILDEQCHRLHVSFVGISKNKFDLSCQRILSRISSRIVSLTLNGDNSSTPGQLALFLTRFPILSSIFIKLESFRLIDFIKMDVELLVPQLSSLMKLKCLSIGNYQRLMPFNIKPEDLFNENVVLPISLRSLAFPYQITDRWMETFNTTESLIERMHIHFIHMDFLFSFLQKFPHLRRLTAVLGGNEDIHSLNSMNFHRLRSLNVNLMHTISFDRFANFLRNVPQLHSLSVEALNPDPPFLESYSWENALPSNLSSFRFDLTMTLPLKPNPLELLPTFQSQYWISRGWFVQCYLRDHGRYFRLSTIQTPIIHILYWPDDELLLGNPIIAIYRNVTHLELWWNLSKWTIAICPNVRSIQLYGATNEGDKPFHSSVCDLLRCPSLKHLIINNNLPITQRRFGSVLLQSSDNVDTLTCSTTWLRSMLEEKDNEWICLLITIRIKKLILIDDETVLSYQNLIAFSRTFFNLQELTMSLLSQEHFFFLLNTLKQLTMVNIQLTNDILTNITDMTQWIEDNTILRDFIVRKEMLTVNKYQIILWIGSHRTSDWITIANYFREISLSD